MSVWMVGVGALGLVLVVCLAAGLWAYAQGQEINDE